MNDSTRPGDREAPKFRVVSDNENVEAMGARPGAQSSLRVPVGSSIYTSIGQCVALHREQCGISRREFSFSLGIKISQLKAYETGEAIFTPDLLLRAAQVLEIQPSKFFVILAERRLADLASKNSRLGESLSVADDAAKVRLALRETISRCDSIITILDIIAASDS